MVRIMQKALVQTYQMNFMAHFKLCLLSRDNLYIDLDMPKRHKMEPFSKSRLDLAEIVSKF